MARPGYATQQDLLRWADSQPGRSEFPRLIRRLVLETTPDLLEITFPAAEGTSVGGWDGVVRAGKGTPFVPGGLSGWELSVDKKTAKKIDDDYEKRTASPDGSPTQDCTYVEVFLRRWSKRKEWAANRSKEKRWTKVEGIGVDDVETWLEEAPITHAWISERLDLGPYGIRTVEAWWSSWSLATNPALPPDLVLAGRKAEVDALRARFSGPAQVTTINAASRDEVLAFVTAFLIAEDKAGQGAMLARTAIVDEVTTWRSLRLRSTPLILVANSDPVVAESGGPAPHQIIVPVASAASADIELSPIDASAASQFLKAALGEKREKDADELGRLSRISLQAARRRIAVKPELLQPTWATRPAPRSIRRLLLGSRWTETEADREVIAKLSSQPYEQLVEEIAMLGVGEDPFLTRIGHAVAVVSPYDAWLLLRSELQAEDLERFRDAVLDVLGAPDPGLDLPPGERWVAAIRGKARPHSHDLREGLAMSLALLGTVGDKAVAGTTWTGTEWATHICWALLDRAHTDALGRAWASLDDVLPLIAEAAPAEFLAAVARDLSGSPPLLRSVFGADDSGMFSHPTHTGLLWALELCAWSPGHFSQSIDLLARLSEIDPGGRYSNRPIDSLQRIFCPWYPQNPLDNKRRLDVIDGLRRRHHDIAWTLMLSGLPEMMAASHPTHAPRFRQWKPPETSVTLREYWEFVDPLVDRLAADSGKDPGKWRVLCEKLDDLPANLRRRWLDRLQAIAEEADLAEADRGLIWETLHSLVARHREFVDASWRLPDAEIDAIEQVADLFKPDSPLIQHRWLFAEHVPSLDSVRRFKNHAEYERTLRELRAKAIEEVANSATWDQIVRFARESRVPFAIGIAIADAGLKDYVDHLVALIDADDPAEYQFARAYCITRNEKEPGWVLEAVSKADARPRQHARLLLCLPEARTGWEAAHSAGHEVAREFWLGFGFLPHPAPQDLATAATRMSDVGRAGAALDLLALWLPEDDHLDLATAILHALDQLLAQGEGQVLPSPHDFEKVFAYLDRSKSVEPGHLALLEWSYLSALEHTGRRLKLFEELAHNPDLFVDLVKRIYRPGDREDEDDASDGAGSVDEATAQVARNGWSLLRQWNIIPGTREDGTIDERELREWVTNVRQRLRELKRSAVGDLHIGHVLARSPADPDGRWPHAVVRDLIEDLKSRDVERGFQNEVINRRGMTSRGLEEGGQQELTLAANFHKQADQLQDTWPTVARILRSVADNYESDARRNEAEAERFRKGLEGTGGGPLQPERTGDVLYFAYGSNMNTARIEERVGKVQVRGPAKLEGWRIAFNKASTDGTGKTNIGRRKGSEVQGVVFGLTQQQFDKLALYEDGYRVETINARIGDELLEVLTFKAEKTTPGLHPTREYLGYLIGGAQEHQLPDAYKRLLETVKVAERPKRR